MYVICVWVDLRINENEVGKKSLRRIKSSRATTTTKEAAAAVSRRSESCTASTTAAASNHQTLRCQTEKASHDRRRHQFIVRKHPDVHTTLWHAPALLRPLVISSRWIYIFIFIYISVECLSRCMTVRMHATQPNKTCTMHTRPERQWIVVTFSYPPSLSRTSCFTESHRFPSPNESVEFFGAPIFLSLSCFHLISLLFSSVAMNKRAHVHDLLPIFTCLMCAMDDSLGAFDFCKQ